MPSPVPWHFTCEAHDWHSARQPCPHGDGTDNNPPVPSTAEAADLIVRAATCGTDFGGWLAFALATAAARLGSTTALLSSRPGSWEADDIRRLLIGTVGEGDEHLGDYRERDRD